MLPRERIVRIILLLLSKPYGYTKKKIEEILDISSRNFDDDVKTLRSLNLNVDCKKTDYTYAILPENEFKELEYLSPLSDQDLARINNALIYCNEKERLYLTKKLDSLYDFQKTPFKKLIRIMMG